MDKILEGDLSRIEVPDLLTFLHMGRKTGVFVLERPEQETKIYVREGQPVFATSTKDSLRFGEVLVRLGKLTPERLSAVLRRQRTGGFRIGQVLLIEKVLKEEELASFLKVQVSEVIFDTFEWRGGTFTFYDSVQPPVTAVTLEMDLQNLIMEGVRRIDERDRLREVFPDLAMVVEAVANPERVKQSVTLTQEEWRVFFLVDGRRSLAEVCQLAGNPDEVATLQIIHNLVLANFVIVLPVPPKRRMKRAEQAPEVTRHMAKAGAEPRPSPVEFAPAQPRRKIDDTREVVTPEAIEYAIPGDRRRTFRLVLIKGSDETSFPLVRDAYTLGRHRNNDIVVTDPKVSSFHARLDRSPDGFVLVDLNSRNGSWVNGQRYPSVLLRTGDEIRVGTARIVYREEW
jgi:hypothetical protein